MDMRAFMLFVLAVNRPSLVAQGNEHSLLVDEMGDLFAFGNNIEGQLGLKEKENVRVPTRVRGLSGVVDACAGGDASFHSFSLVLLKNATVVSFGDGRFGQIGRRVSEEGEDNDWRALPVEGLDGETVVGVACGGRHSAAWTAGGKLFIWGNGNSGRLGLNDTEIRWNATLVTAPLLEGEFVTQAALGGAHTVVACKSGRVFSWGSNPYGQLGNGRSVFGGYETSPVEVVAAWGEEKVVAVAAGDRHSLVLTSSGKVFAFGENGDLGFGQLGLGSEEESFSTPQWVERLPGRASQIAAGRKHSFVLLEDKRVFSFGQNKYGQLGLGHTDDQREPRDVVGIRAEGLWKGGGVSAFRTGYSLLITEGGVVGTGSNEEGQLGLGSGLRGSARNVELSFVPILTALRCPPLNVDFPNDRGASFWRSSRVSFASFFPFPVSSLDREGDGNSPTRIQTEFFPAVEPRLFDVGEPVEIHVRLSDSLSQQNEGSCEFILRIKDTESPILTCSPPLTLKVSRQMPPLTFPPPTEIRDNVDALPDGPINVGLSYSHLNRSDSKQLFESGDAVQVRAEGTDRSGNKGSCIMVVTADECPSNSERDTPDSPCLCEEDYYHSPLADGFVCLPCDRNSHSKRGSTDSSKCLCKEGFYGDPSFSNSSICRQCIPNSNTTGGATHPSQCICTEKFYFSPPDTKTSEGELIVSLPEIISHNDPINLFTSGTCEPCPLHSFCSGIQLTPSQVSEVLRQSRLPKALTGREGDCGTLRSDTLISCGRDSQPLSPLRLLEAQSEDVHQQMLKQLMAHPRPVPHKNFSLVQRWPRAVIVPCPFAETCLSVEPGQADLSGLQIYFQGENAGTLCEEGHVGPLCSECKRERHLLRRGTDVRCHECSPSVVRVLTAIGLFLAFVVLVLAHTSMVTKDNPKMDVPEHAVAVKILTVFVTALGFLADLARPAFIVFREELEDWGVRERRESQSWESNASMFLAKAAEDLLDFLRKLPTVGEVFSMKCVFDLFPWTAREEHLAGRELLSLLVPLGAICLIGTVGLVIVLSSYCRGAETKREGEAPNERENPDPSCSPPPAPANTGTVAAAAVAAEEGAAGALTGLRDTDQVNEGSDTVDDDRHANRFFVEQQSTQPLPCSSSKSFAQVCERFKMRLAYNRRSLGLFRRTFDRETGLWVRLMSLHEDMTPVILATIFLWASSLVEAPLASLRCEPLHPSIRERRLHSFPSITCHWPLRSSDDPYSRWWGVSLAVLFGGVFGVPLLICCFMLLNSVRVGEAKSGEGGPADRKQAWKKKRATEREGDIRAEAEGEESLPATHKALMQNSERMHLASFRRQFSLLLGGYGDKFLFWELVIFARRLSIPICLLAPSTSARYTILTFHAVLFFGLQAILQPYRSADLNWLETFSLTVWLGGVLVLKAVSDRTISLAVRVALVYLLLSSIAAFVVRSLLFIVSDRLSTRKKKKEEEEVVWTCLPKAEKEWWKRIAEKLWQFLVKHIRRCSCVQREKTERQRSPCLERIPLGRFLSRLLCCQKKTNGRSCCKRKADSHCCRCSGQLKSLHVRLQEGGHSLVPVRVLRERGQQKMKKDKGHVAEVSRRTRQSISSTLPGASLEAPEENLSRVFELSLTLSPSERRAFERCLRDIDEDLEVVHMKLNSERERRGVIRGTVPGNFDQKWSGHLEGHVRASAHDLRHPPFLLSFCFRLGVLSDASMNLGRAKEDSNKRFIASSCEEMAEHCAIVRELLRVPHPGAAPPMISGEGDRLCWSPRIPLRARLQEAPAGDEHSVASGVSPSSAPPSVVTGGAGKEKQIPISDKRSPSLRIAVVEERAGTGRQREPQGESFESEHDSLSLEGLPLSDHPSLLDFAERRMASAEATHALACLPANEIEVAEAAANAASSDAPSLPGHGRGKEVDEVRETSATPAVVPPNPHQAERETNEKRHKKPQSAEDKGEQRLLQSPLREESQPGRGDLVRQRRDRYGKRVSVQSDRGNRCGDSFDCKSDGEDRIVSQRQWTEEDAETADGVLTERLIVYSHDAATRQVGGRSCSSLEGWLRGSATEKERRCFGRMTALYTCFLAAASTCATSYSEFTHH
uniref:Uncharacterized protein n=1 Tax=Chromera velia CCMP2878 TaxID=1169474 RepID=A0A0G4HPQ8_9ALVE|eukprot:Cvel_7840.t1-p1 / transcript=Cvel_7840.t1 / gene=Cvel_7840 / organism=Chromera_velia_CCMP2878 / gene_product=Probable E3 ubiquitin-protein ligase HERC1, putative / transcript_product=Probable E3 ubiquitin-protein ligase HERC1, putative / location=Cvel_scaffold419:40069-48635(-) / protein_length=2086 / sequence_SO=supercontig / SO=protein_coding / is_pseudo=false